MKREPKTCSIIELPIVTEKWQKDILDKKMDCARRIYNRMLDDMLKKYHEMVKTREWRELSATIKEELQKQAAASKKTKSEALKTAYARKNEILRENGFSEFSFNAMAVEYSKYYQKHISSTMAMLGIAQPMWRAFEKLIFGNGERVSLKKYGSVLTISSDNRSAIRYINKDGEQPYIFISNIRSKAKNVKLIIKGPENDYDREMINANVKIVRVIKKIEKGHRKYYCQLTVDRPPVIKLDQKNNPKHQIGSGSVGICIWRNTLCAVSSNKAIQINLIPDEEEFTLKRAELSRLAEHLRRVNNPDNYEEDGQIKKGIIGEDGKRHRLHWNESNHYKRTRDKLRELNRKHSVKKNFLQNETVYKLLEMGDHFYYADVSFLTKKPEWDEEEPLPISEYKKKKERRRSIQEAAPSTLLSKLDKKLTSLGLEAVQRYDIPEELYWYTHDKGVSDKENFAGKKIIVNGIIVEQTMYRAFLISHFDDKIKVFNQKSLAEDWDNFIKNTV